MTRKQLVVNMGLMVFFCLVGLLCYRTGKAYDLIFENTPYTVDGKIHPAVEALQVTIDAQRNPVYLLEGDRQTGMAIGLKHQLTIEILDENDKVIATKVVAFSVDDLGEKRVVNVPRMYAFEK